MRKGLPRRSWACPAALRGVLKGEGASATTAPKCTKVHPRAKIATRARPTYLPSPSRRAWSPGPTYLPLATLEKGCNISATKAWVSEGPSSIVGFSSDRSCPFMSIFCLENRILCLDGLDIFSELQGSSGSQRSMQIHAESMHVCTFSASDLPTYPRCRAATSRPDLPTYPLCLVVTWTYLLLKRIKRGSTSERVESLGRCRPSVWATFVVRSF